MRTFVVACWLACIAAVGYGQEHKVQVNSIRLYLPDAALRDRLGDDVSPLAGYIKALQAEASAYWEKADKPKAGGLLIAVGVKPDKKARVWCDAVGGEIPAGTLAELEKKLGAVSAVAVKNGPVAFAIEIRLWGDRPEKFPELPRAWQEAARKSDTPVMIPDGLFKIMWPD